MRRAAKVDRNQPEIVKALRAIGASVQPLHTIGQGCPDLLVGYKNKNYLMEVKDGLLPPSKKQLTEDEANWFVGWQGHAIAVESINDALAAIGICQNDHLT